MNLAPHLLALSFSLTTFLARMHTHSRMRLNTKVYSDELGADTHIVGEAAAAHVRLKLAMLDA